MMIHSTSNWKVAAAEEPPEETPVYGCVKPTTKSTLHSHKVSSGQHGLTFTEVLFTGMGVTSSGGATAGMALNSSGGDIYDILYDRCVFKTSENISAPSNAYHAWNLTGANGPYGVIHHVTFRDCWFEPASRLGMEVNGRGGWIHDWTIERCTFEACNGEVLSYDMSSGNYSLEQDTNPATQYGVMVNNVRRGFEGISVKNCLIYGTGPTAGVTNISASGTPVTFYDPRPGYPTSYRKNIEFGCVYPYANDNTIGRSEFIGNKVGKCYSSVWQTNYSGASYMTIRDNLIDQTYDPHDCSGNQVRLFDGVSMSHATFDGNKYVLPSHTLGSIYGDYTEANSRYNTMTDEDWSKPAGALSSAAFPYGTGSVYTGCQFNLPRAIAFSSQATGNGNVFNAYGYTGGDGSMT